MMRGDEFAGRRSNFVHTTIGVVGNEFVKYKDTAHVMNTLEQVHKMADLPNKSNYLIDKPKLTGNDSVVDDYNKTILIIEEDEARPKIDTSKKIGRNELCPCGSGKKYKKCCGANL